MIEHVYRRAAEARGVDGVIVATDDTRIAECVERFGGIARMTRAEHRTGTDRIAEVVHDLPCDIVINVQGDEPLIRPDTIEQVIGAFGEDGVLMATLRRPITDPHEHSDPNVVKVVVDRNGDALYFSRSPVPFLRDASAAPPSIFKHIGLYGYRRDFLLSFAALPQTTLEIAESLEQLRALEHGYRIRTVETAHDSIGVDTPEDLNRARRQLQHLTAAARA
jgi:3-deoxy-manno-octulosonate cytidylyltransferase (CMP-KDO synthetase)